jgi:hypothetical protein
LILPISISCSSLEGRLDAASQQQGQAQARVTLPDAPAELRKQEAHAAIAEGMEALSVLKRERAALDQGERAHRGAGRRSMGRSRQS